MPLLELSNEQPVRPHIRPCHPDGAVKTVDRPDFKASPVVLMFSLGISPGQIVSLQRFTIVKFVHSENHGPVTHHNHTVVKDLNDFKEENRGYLIKGLPDEIAMRKIAIGRVGRDLAIFVSLFGCWFVGLTFYWVHKGEYV